MLRFTIGSPKIGSFNTSLKAPCSGCCGSSVQHIGDNRQALELARRNIDAWLGQEFDAIVINASGCGTTVKDYGHMFADDPAWRDKAERVARLAKDVSELMVEIGLANVTPHHTWIRAKTGGLKSAARRGV